MRRFFKISLLLVTTRLLPGLTPVVSNAQGQPPPEYRTRTSQCRHDPPPGVALTFRRSDTGVSRNGYTTERILTQIADARRINGGEILICTEYGRVEIIDSDDDQVRLQIRLEGFGEGSPQPVEAAARVFDETNLHTYVTAHQGKLMVRVWHSTLGFTNPGAQPAWVNVRVQVPRRGAYRVRTEAFHGFVSIRRLTLASAVLRGNVGEKFKGIPGYIGLTELDNVELVGDVDIDNLVGLPGIREPVPASMITLAAPITVKARIGASCQLKAVTGGGINIAIQPAPNLGVRAQGESNTGRVNIVLDTGVTTELAGDSNFQLRRLVTTTGYEAKPIRLEVRAASAPGNVNIASLPAAPLASRPTQ